MSTPIRVPALPGQKEKGMTRFEKEKLFIMHNVNKRLEELNFENYFYLAKSVCFWFGFVFAILGVVLIVKGNSLTPLFAADPFDMTMIITGGCFCLPLIAWFGYVFLLPVIPSVGRKRKLMRDMRKERKNPSLFNQMVSAAEEDSKPPVKKIRIYLMFRKHEFSVSCHTVKEMCDQIEYRTGLRPGQQLFKLKNEEVDLPLECILEDDLGIRDGTKFDLYNRGGFVYDVKVSPEHRLTLPRTGNTDDETSSVMDRSISKFKRDPHAYMRELSIEEGSTNDVSTLGKDQSTIAGPIRPSKPYASGAASLGTGNSSPDASVTEPNKTAWNSPEPKKKSGFVNFLSNSTKAPGRSSKVAVDDVPDDVSALTEAPSVMMV